jgi:hypothetical protein
MENSAFLISNKNKVYYWGNNVINNSKSQSVYSSTDCLPKGMHFYLNSMVIELKPKVYNPYKRNTLYNSCVISESDIAQKLTKSGSFRKSLDTYEAVGDSFLSIEDQNVK